ncbi:hypothetical protein [Streptomyces griseoruber]|uniref:hypothetical protein n=1 Tax=Streptomyces griseoruber TaxID=1943 RepID=UPI0007440056|nr:hypothetical protein [Streptomyces griseoruber]
MPRPPPARRIHGDLHPGQVPRAGRDDAEVYLALDPTWAEPPGEPRCGRQWEGGGRTVPSLVERDGTGSRQAAVVEIDASGPVPPGVTVEGATARFRYAREGRKGQEAGRTPVGPPLDRARLSDDHGGRLRCTGTPAGVRVRDPVDAAFTADFRNVRWTCTAADRLRVSEVPRPRTPRPRASSPLAAPPLG